MPLKRTWKTSVRPLRVVGDVVEIDLNNGLVALVDLCDRQIVEGWNWSSTKATRNGLRYATRGSRGRTIRLHNEILCPPSGLVVDHHDGNGLNCRRANLRTASHSQNCANRRLGSANTSGFKGVFYRADRGTWLAMIAGTKLGTFSDIEAAARAYDAEALVRYGEFAHLNLPNAEAA